MRKGQFYMLDAFFAAAILFLGLTIVVSDIVAQPDLVQAQAAIEDITELLYQEELGRITNPYVVANYDIIDETLTPAEQAHLWVSNTSCGWCGPNATALLESIVTDPLPKQHGVAVIINGTEVVNRSLNHPATFRIVEVQLVHSSPGIGELWGPDPVEVMVWA